MRICCAPRLLLARCVVWILIVLIFAEISNETPVVARSAGGDNEAANAASDAQRSTFMRCSTRVILFLDLSRSTLLNSQIEVMRI